MRGLGLDAVSTWPNAALPLMMLEILYVALVLFGLFARCECTEIAAFTGLFVDLARIDPVCFLIIFGLGYERSNALRNSSLARSNTRLRFSDNPFPARLM